MKCEKCNDEHDGSYGSGRFCGSKCSHSFSTMEKRDEINKKVSEKLTVTGKYKRHYEITECINCNKPINNRGKFCSVSCAQELEYKEYIKRWKEGLETGMCGKRGVSNYLRKYMFNKHENKCSCCGWNKIHPKTNNVPLQIHHKDGNSSNYTEENIELLCPNCHALTETFGALNKGKGGYRYKYKNECINGSVYPHATNVLKG